MLSSAYTGYIDNQGRHIFFYFFESRNNPSKDDVIFWTNGGMSQSLVRKKLLHNNSDTGPGCASSVGMFMENGPCVIQQKDDPVYNAYSWTTSANVFWVDQPVGVGYSYADYDISVVCSTIGWHVDECPAYLTTRQSTTEQAAQDIAAFLAIFFQHFTDFQGRPFHMAGESYGVSPGYIYLFSGNKAEFFFLGSLSPYFCSAGLRSECSIGSAH